MAGGLIWKKLTKILLNIYQKSKNVFFGSPLTQMAQLEVCVKILHVYAN
jgi:hypothetical protein